MGSLVVTIIVSAILLLLAVGGLAIGLILTGKPIARGTCGYNPKKKRTGECGKKIKCSLCERESSER